MILLTNESHRKDKKYVIFPGKNLKKNKLMMKNILKLEVIVIITCEKRFVAHGICNSRQSAPKEIVATFHLGPNYNYNFFITNLAEEFERESNFLGENKEKYKTFSVLMKKRKKIVKRGNKIKDKTKS